MGAGGERRFQHDVGALFEQLVEPLDHHPPGGEIAGRTRAGERPRHLVRIDELERLRALSEEGVDEGGLAGAVRTGEEDEGLQISLAASASICSASLDSASAFSLSSSRRAQRTSAMAFNCAL